MDSDDDMPDPLGEGPRRIVGRLYDIQEEGTEDPAQNCELVQWLWAPFVYDGAVQVRIDTDGFAFNPGIVEAMVRVFVEELEPAGVAVFLTAGPMLPDELTPVWRSSHERAAC